MSIAHPGPAWIVASALLVLPAAAAATAELCAVNPLTREGAVFEEGDYMGIGWRPVGERACAAFEGQLAALGYRRTDSPHRIERLLASVALALAAGLASALWRHRGRRRPTTP